MIAVFARPNHPHYITEQWGNGPQDSYEWRYHGYVVIMVHCKDYPEALAVKAKLMNEGLAEPYQGHESMEQGWYGGRMELVALLKGNKISPEAHMVSSPLTEYNTKQSMGDNRFTGFYEAEEILND